MYIKLLEKLTLLDGGTLKSDSKLSKLIKRNVTKPIGFYFRQKLFNAKYPTLKIK